MEKDAPATSSIRVIDEIGERMKGYEKESQKLINHNLPMMARIDGHKFSKWTRGFEKPFESRVHLAMCETTKDLVNNFHAITGYTQSDEITLVFPLNSVGEDGNLISNYIFGGKVVKICSILASYATVRFNFHMLMIFENETDLGLLQKIKKMTAHFDARVFNLPNTNEILNNILWRSSFDCVRNSVSNLAHCHFPQKEILKIGTQSLKKKLLEKGIDWEKMPDSFKYGSFIKKRLVEKTAINEQTKEEVKVLRGETIIINKFISSFTQENLEWILAKYAS